MEDAYVSDCCGEPIVNLVVFNNSVRRATCTACGNRKAVATPNAASQEQARIEVHDIGFIDSDGQRHPPAGDKAPIKRHGARSPAIREYHRDECGIDAIGWENLGKKMGYPQH